MKIHKSAGLPPALPGMRLRRGREEAPADMGRRNVRGHHILPFGGDAASAVLEVYIMIFT